MSDKSGEERSYLDPALVEKISRQFEASPRLYLEIVGDDLNPALVRFKGVQVLITRLDATGNPVKPAPS